MGHLMCVTIDCSDAVSLARFWGQALPEYNLPNGGILMSAEGKPSIYFQAVPEPKSIKDRLHLDVGAPDVPAEVARLAGLGARVLQEMQEGGHKWTVMADPEGNEFCVCPA